MRSIRAIISLIITAVLAASIALAQGGVKPSVASGEVVSISDGAIVLKTKDGELKVKVLPESSFKRVPPETPTLQAAVASSLAEIEPGDKLMVTGIFGEDKTVLPARSVYLISKASIDAKQQKEAHDWATRSISGKVVSVDGPTSTITVAVRGLMSTTDVAVTPKADGTIKRYAPNSIKYSEAVESTLADVKPGDMLRALGDRSADGAKFAAEVVLTGAFQTVAGTVKSIDPAKGEIVVADSAIKKDVTIAVGAGTTLKKFPEEMAARFAQFGGARPGAGGQGEARGEGQRPQGQRPEGQRPEGQRPAGQPGQGVGAPGAGRGFGGGTRSGIDDLYERLPAIQISDLKVGDMIAVSSSKGADEQHITAIKVLAGVEPFLRLAQASGGRGGRGGSGQNTGFTIPGLDGFDFP